MESTKITSSETSDPHKTLSKTILSGLSDPEALCPYNVYNAVDKSRQSVLQEKKRSNNPHKNQTRTSDVFALAGRDAEALCPYNVFKVNKLATAKTTVAQPGCETSRSLSPAHVILAGRDAEALCPYNIFKNRSQQKKH